MIKHNEVRIKKISNGYIVERPWRDFDDDEEVFVEIDYHNKSITITRIIEEYL